MTAYPIPDAAKPAADIISLCVVVASLASLLPSVAAALSIVWTLIRIGETETFRNWRERRKRRADGDGRCG